MTPLRGRLPSKGVRLGPSLSAGLIARPAESGHQAPLLEEEGGLGQGLGQAWQECPWTLDTVSPWTFLLGPWSTPSGFPQGLE